MLSHPLIVEAIETLFVPIAVKNNTKGDTDEKVLKSFSERSWNNPVVRIVDGARSDLVPKVKSDWSRSRLVEAMIAALEKTKRKVPAYLDLLREEEGAARKEIELAIFGMG